MVGDCFFLDILSEVEGDNLFVVKCGRLMLNLEFFIIVIFVEIVVCIFIYWEDCFVFCKVKIFIELVVKEFIVMIVYD